MFVVSGSAPASAHASIARPGRAAPAARAALATDSAARTMYRKHNTPPVTPAISATNSSLMTFLLRGVKKPEADFRAWLFVSLRSTVAAYEIRSLTGGEDVCVWRQQALQRFDNARQHDLTVLSPMRYVYTDTIFCGTQTRAAHSQHNDARRFFPTLIQHSAAAECRGR
jgi:hypothetical protein